MFKSINYVTGETFKENICGTNSKMEGKISFNVFMHLYYLYSRYTNESKAV